MHIYTQPKKILTYLKPYQGLFLIGMMILCFSSLMGVFFPILLGKLFGAKQVGSFAFTDFSLDNINMAFLVLLIVFGVQSLMSFFRIILFSKVTESALSDLRKELYQKLITLPLPFYHKNKVGEITARFSSDIALLQETFTTVLAEFIRQIILIIGSFIFLIWISPKMTLLMLITLPLMSVIALFFGRYIRKMGKITQETTASMNALVEETLRGILIVKSFSREAWEFLKFQKISQEVKEQSLKNAFWRGLFVSFIIFCMLGSILLMIWYGLLLKEKGEMSEANFFSFLFSSIFIGVSIGSLPELYAKLQKAFGASDRLMEWLDQPCEPLSFLPPFSNTSKASKLTKALPVEFKSVSFYYESRPDLAVLQDISFQIEQGKTVALVGSSGAGKSTVAGLMLRFFEPQKGQILLGNQDIAQLSLSDWRNYIALVPQEVFLFGGSIEENIAYGKPTASKEEIWQAVEKANMLDFIERFPDGLQTIVGDRGIQLSGGQKQRVAIARAILKDPAILILDEATSSLDTESEKLVQHALDQLMQNRTSIIIAHRLTTIKNADQIFVLDKGKIAEKGTHEELIKKQGMYYQLNNN